MRGLLPMLIVGGAVLAQPALAGSDSLLIGTTPRLSDAELAKVTGKFIMPNGVAVALSVTSDTVLNGQTILRTVLTVDKAAQVSVLGRTGDTAVSPIAPVIVPGSAVESSTAMAPTGVSVMFDRSSGTHIVTPSYSTTSGLSVSTNPAAASAAASNAGLSKLDIVPGGPAVQTSDGLVSLSSLPNGTQVILAGDQLNISHIVGQAIATAVVNSGNDRTIDTVTNVNIDLGNAQALAIGSASLRAQDLAMDATRGMIR